MQKHHFFCMYDDADIDVYKQNLYQNNVVSSHWKHYLKSMTGFGTVKENTIKNKLKYGIELYLAKFLFKKHGCDPFLIHTGKMVCVQQNRLFDFDCVKQVLSLDKIIKTIPEAKINSICIIGDGYGYLTSLIRNVYPDVFIICINLKEILDIDEQYYRIINPFDSKIVFIDAREYSRIKDYHANLFINIVGMQEMNQPVIVKYFEYMRESKAKDKYFYCCSRQEKTLPDGTVIRFSEYLWGDSEILFDELCPWYQEYPQSLPPFWRPFDGAVQHRMVKL